jgi:cellobiose-specific phosphotransferase system component IIB
MVKISNFGESIKEKYEKESAANIAENERTKFSQCDTMLYAPQIIYRNQFSIFVAENEKKNIHRVETK